MKKKMLTFLFLSICSVSHSAEPRTFEELTQREQEFIVSLGVEILTLECALEIFDLSEWLISLGDEAYGPCDIKTVDGLLGPIRTIISFLEKSFTLDYVYYYQQGREIITEVLQGARDPLNGATYLRNLKEEMRQDINNQLSKLDELTKEGYRVFTSLEDQRKLETDCLFRLHNIRKDWANR